MEPVETLDQKAADLTGHSSRHLTTPKAGEDQELTKDKARRMWSTLSVAVHESIEKIKRSDWKPLELEHGLQHVQRVRHKRDIQHVMFNVVTKEFICMLSRMDICIYYCDGRKTRELSLQEPLEGLVYSHQVNRYVGWTRCPQLKVLSADFKTLSVNQASHSITCCRYNQDLNQIITAGIGNICSWHFYFGCRDLMCSTTITQGLTEDDVFTDLVLERSPVSAPAVARVQHCYAVCGTGVATFDLTKGILLTYEKHLHNRKITGITIVEALRCVATSSQDGNIKVWDQRWNLQMMFIGHRGPVTALATYPDGPCLLSASKDGTLRVWSLEMADQVDEIQVGVTVTCLGTVQGEDHIFSCAHQRLDFWTIVRLHVRHTAVGYAVRAINVTNIALASHFPVRAACSCADGTARLISPETGDVISTLLLEQGRQVVNLDYCLPREALLALTDQGDLLKGNSLTNPMEVLMKVPHGSQASPICCFCIYAHMSKVSVTHSRWQQAVNGGSEEKIRLFATKDNDWYLVMAGHVNGLVSVLDWSSGSTQYKVQAHESAEVLTLVPDPDNQRLFSSGLDNTVKVWRVFPYAQDSLTLLMTFFGAHSPTHLCLLKSAFVVALQNTASAVHSIVLYDTRKKIRKDHHPDSDHKDEITGLSSCPDLKIFASTSRAGTLKIWDHNNQLIRIVHLKAIAESISFCNNKGDLLLGIEKNLHHMSSDKYLTQSYLLRVACRDHSDPLLDNPIPISRTAADSLSPSDHQRLGQVRSFKHGLEHIQISPEEPDEETIKKQEQLKEAYALLASREQELLLIQRGELKRKRKPPHSKEVQQEGFRRYMRLLYGQAPQIKIPEQEMADSAEQQVEPTLRPQPPHKCTNVRKGFFPSLVVPKPWDEVTECEKEARGLPYWAGPPDIPIALDGFIPNSVFLRLLWPMEPWEAPDDPEEEVKVKVEVEEEEDEGPEVEWKPDLKLPPKLETRVSQELKSSDSEHSSVFLNKLEATREREPPKVEEKLEIKSEVQTPQEPEVEKIPSPISRPSPVRGRSSLQKLEAPTSPPLPLLVQRFKEEAWFSKAFPSVDSDTFPPALTEEDFVLMLIDQLRVAEYEVKEGVTKALVMLLPSQPPNITRLAHETLTAVLSGSNPPQAEIREQREFIRTALWALKELIPHSKELFVELMVQFLQSDIILRNTVKAMLDGLGLQDPHNYFEVELSSWGGRDDQSAPPTHKLRSLSQAWLRKWIQKFKDHIRDAARSLKAGNTLSATIPVSPSADPRGHHKVNQRPGKASALRLSAPQTPGSLDTVRPIEAVNYFCQLQLQQELQELRATEGAPEEGPNLNTVLLLPKVTRDQAILRLGETRKSVTTEKLRLPPLSLPPLSFALGRVIRLPVAKVRLNPFPSPIDRVPLQLLTLRRSDQRFFILQHSLVGSYC